MKTKSLQVLIATCALLLTSCDKGGDTPTPPLSLPTEVQNYNYVIGTQTIGPAYKLTSDTKLVETAKQIIEMGSNILKIDLKPSQYGLSFNHSYSHELLQNEPSFKAVMEMSFRYFFFWAYNPQADLSWLDGLSAQEAQSEYDNIYKLADYLFKTFAGTNKEFYIGHWEGDWHLTNSNGEVQTVDPARLQGMIDWLNKRQQAIDAARAANSSSTIKVYQYCEVNRVLDALDKNYDRIVNKVLPNINVDYVSYSSYDAIQKTSSYTALNNDLNRALNYLEQQLPAKPSITGKRIFIGEYGYPNIAYGEQKQDDYTRMVLKSALTWGCPFILYWEMYNNEVQTGGTHNGYWLINNRGVKQKTYYTHQGFLDQMKQWVNSYLTDNKHLPSREEYNTKAKSMF